MIPYVGTREVLDNLIQQKANHLIDVFGNSDPLMVKAHLSKFARELAKKHGGEIIVELAAGGEHIMWDWVE